ncbi:peptidoglycan DD-metalloendopeptidase family protein [Methylophaga thiooxydans]|uniref:peptidoglycan DD-metalloendopeptidase family protein n=1 Tax=Methylophaga thiooxydans TaxID=392484 RepID=UPI002355189E|nr:peptidoglycan DD-metalloendopeptidase family protein [Methylophaga thiooxydans]
MKWILLLLLITTLTACGGGGRAVAPVGSYDSSKRKISTPPNFYTVQRGDTLYSISWRYGMDYKDVARINSIRSPYTIYVGQKLHFKANNNTRKQTSTRNPTQPTYTKPPAPVPKPKSQVATKPTTAKSASAPAPTSSAQPFTGSQNLQWRWPTEGNIVSTYSNSSPGRKGIDIAGRAGQQINAAASGKVVYSGSGLPRYGNLLIIKHNDVYLSAYAHSDKLLVKEGEIVTAGQKIALMGRTGTQRDQLHFEIRRNGKPIDPMRFLPKR